VRSSRQIEKATPDDIAFLYLAANQHPDHDTIAAFRPTSFITVDPDENPVSVDQHL